MNHEQGLPGLIKKIDRLSANWKNPQEAESAAISREAVPVLTTKMLGSAKLDRIYRRIRAVLHE